MDPPFRRKWIDWRQASQGSGKKEQGWLEGVFCGASFPNVQVIVMTRNVTCHELLSVSILKLIID